MKQHKFRQILARTIVLSCITVLSAGCETSREDASPSHTVDGYESNPDKESGTDETTSVGEQVIGPKDLAPEDENNGTDKDASSKEDTVQEDSCQNQEQDPSLAQPAPSVEELYEQFLQDNLKATVRDDFSEYETVNPVVKMGSSYTLTELGQAVSAWYLKPEYSDKTSYDSIQYAYMECLDNSSKKLLVKFIGLNIYAPDDDSYLVFILTEEDGQLYVTDGYECWARSATKAYQNGYLDSSGSNGAGDHSAALLAVLSNGKATGIYQQETLSGSFADLGGGVYNEVFGENYEVPTFVVSITTIGDETYYTYGIDECPNEDLTLCQTYIDRCREELGINWVSEKEVQDAIENRCAFLGIPYDKTQDTEEVLWNNL